MKRKGWKLPVLRNDIRQKSELDKIDKSFKSLKNRYKMGKRIIGVIAFAAIAVAAGWNYLQNRQEVELSDLALENVEALASGETVSPCKGYGSVLCSYNNIWVYEQNKN